MLLLIIGFFVGRYARDNYFVTFDRDQNVDVDDRQVVIYQGRPGGVWWFDPTLEERTAVLGLDLTDALQLELDEIPEFDTIGQARAYVDDLLVRAAGT